MSADFWAAAGTVSLAVATVVLAAHILIWLRVRRDPRKRKALQLELPLAVAAASVAGVLIGEFATGRHPHADLDELKTLIIPVLSGMSCRSLLLHFGKEARGTQSLPTGLAALVSLLIGIFVAGGTAYLGT
ncbi:hypothetical protein [Streptomyces thermoalcalitolerans]|uniref:Uncharacterized protein n=1 Tax=Streptomyces thermoalcalitolerans TaxID=65605 RepID=A0ABN1NBY3_9ACTN